MKYKIILYEKENGCCPVLEFILSLNPGQQAKLYREIDLLEEFGNLLHYPHIRKITEQKYRSLWELRIKFATDIFRIIYYSASNNECILLHGFRKKSNKTADKELSIALFRKADYSKRFKK